MSDFIRPEVSVEEIGDRIARLSVAPLERGYGETLGNSLRRVLLSSLTGAAVDSIRIDGVMHEFTTIEGVYEDVTDIVLNVKGVVVRSLGTAREGRATINVDGPMTVTAGDFDVPAGFEVVNPDHVVCTLGEGAHLTMSMHISVGRGYLSGEESDDGSIGTVFVDALYSPVVRCAKTVQDFRVGRRTDYDRLVVEVETNGAVAPRDAIVEAASILDQHMQAIMSLGDVADGTIFEDPASGFDESYLDRAIEGLDLSVRAYNCLKRAGIHTVGQLVGYSEDDLLSLRNFGVTSINEVNGKLAEMDLHLRED